jgi:hypothetical protein
MKLTKTEKTVKYPCLLALYTEPLPDLEKYNVQANLLGFMSVLVEMDKQVQISKEGANEKRTKQNSK